MSKMQVVILVVLVVLAVGTIGAVMALSTTAAQVPVSTETPMATATQTFTPTSTATPVVMPPTWTPAPSITPSSTPIRMTSTPLPASNIPTFPPGSIQLSGAGSLNSYIFALPDGQVTVNWKYSGAPGDGSFTSPVPSNCQYLYDVENTQYIYLKQNLELHIQEAVASGSAWSYQQWKNTLDIETNRHNNMMTTIDNRCKPQTTTKSSSITVNLCHSTTNACQAILSYTGISGGSYKLATKKGSDYYLSVQTPGSWTFGLVP
jgi:hypothetical protein